MTPMGFMTPDTPEPPPPPAPPRQEATREEAGKVADIKEKRRVGQSSYRDSTRAGAVNPAYSSGYKTHQGQ